MNRRTVIFLNSVAFVLGFTIVFSLVGVLLQTLLSSVAFDVVNILRTVGGLIIIIFGILLIVSLKYSIPFLASEHKIKIRRFSNSYITSFVFGIAFAIGWTPCVGAILGSIYTLAAVSPGIGFILLLAYSLGILFYINTKPFRHMLWHLSVLMGSALHFLVVFQILA